MILHHIIQCLFLLLGIVTLWAALFDRDWFFTSKNAEPVVKRLGRKKSRWLYGIIGVLQMATAVYFYFQIRRLEI